MLPDMHKQLLRPVSAGATSTTALTSNNNKVDEFKRKGIESLEQNQIFKPQYL